MNVEDYGSNRDQGLDPIQAQMSKAIINKTRGKAEDALKQIKKVFMIGCDTIVNENLMKEIIKKNYSRIPVYYGKKEDRLVIGILLTKSLVGLDFTKERTVQELISSK